MATASQQGFVRPVSRFVHNHGDFRRNVEDFRSEGFTKLSCVLSPHILTAVELECTAVAEARWAARETSRAKDAYQLAFDYTMNVWCESACIKGLALSPVLGEIAANLLGVPSVRLSHDQVLYKRPGSPGTPAHADQYHWPVSHRETITLWIPLQPVAPNQGRLVFFRGSHRLQPVTLRELFALSPEEVEFFLRQCGFTEVEPVLELGDATAHYGWTFHGSGGNVTSETRKVYGLVYMAANIKLVAPEYGPPLEFLGNWCPGARVGGPMHSEHNPIVFTGS